MWGKHKNGIQYLQISNFLLYLLQHHKCQHDRLIKIFLINGASAPFLIAILAIFLLSVDTTILLNKFDFLQFRWYGRLKVCLKFF